MKLNVQWVSEYVPVSLSTEALSHTLTMAGIEVERIERVEGMTIFDLEITPNRPDCLNMVGLARELGAILNVPYTFPKIARLPKRATCCPIVIADSMDCRRYIGAVISGVTVAPAPRTMQKKLSSVGVRAINNVVDVTNFCLMETGQPLHAFDYDTICGGKISVRRAKKGERIVTIDDVDRELDESILVIADEKRPIAIAGIMGGKNTEVSEKTKNILLESAYFNPILIRRAARKLGLASDASYRFERGVDHAGVEVGARRALFLIEETVGGNVTQYTDQIAAPHPDGKKRIAITVDQINTRLGSTLSTQECRRTLKRLDCTVSGEGKKIVVVPPSFRSDLRVAVDVVEEVARVVGFGNLPERMPQVACSSIITEPARMVRRMVRDTLTASGLNEIITYTMIHRQLLIDAQATDVVGILVKNPLTAEQELMRPTLLPSMLGVVAGNIRRGQKDLHLFETGKIYTAGKERETLGIIMTGVRAYDWRQVKKTAVDFYDIKGCIEQIGARLRIAGLRFSASDISFFEKGQGAICSLCGTTIGVVGRVADTVLRAWEIKQSAVFFAEIDLAAVYASAKEKRAYQPTSEYPAIGRDISLAIKKEITFDEVCAVARQKGGAILKDIVLKEEYLGEKIPPGNRGIIFSLKYQSDERTLREDEVAAVHESICQAYGDRFGAIRR